MSGQAGARGYLVQSLICVLDSIDSSNAWVSVTIEPNDESEKVDIAWQCANSRKVVQVKSSQNQIDLPSVRRWSIALENSTQAAEYELRLLGPCSAAVAEIGTIGKVIIRPPQSVDLTPLVEQAAQKLDHYLTRRFRGRRLGPTARELIIEALSHRLGRMSTKGQSLSRQEFDTLLNDWIRETVTALPSSISDPQFADIDSYLRRFQDHLNQLLPPLVDATIESKEVRYSSSELLDFMCRGKHGQLVGPSGYGKSHLARHMALYAAKSGRVPIFARAIEYSGSLSEILDRAVATYCPCSAQNLLGVAQDGCRNLVIVIDGVNECPLDLQANLLQELQACYLRWHTPFLLTSQAEVASPPELSTEVFTFSDFNDVQRHSLLRLYHQGELPANFESLCQAFRSPFELSLAAQCLGEISEHQNRAGLFDAYLRVRSRGHHDIFLLRRVLAAIAGLMRRQLRSSLALAEVERVAERILENQQVPVTSLQSMMEAGFLDIAQVDIAQGQCTFRHELLQRFFEAIDLMNSNAGVDELVTELRKPAHHSLIEYILGRESDSERFLDILRGTAGIHPVPAIISDCLCGRYGTGNKIAIERDVDRSFQNAHAELTELTVEIKTTEFDGRRHQSLEVLGQRERGPYETAIWNAITNELSHGRFLDDSLHLVSETERVITMRLTDLLGETRVRKSAIRSQMFYNIFVLGSQLNRLPTHRLVEGSGWNWRNYDSKHATLKLAQSCDCESEPSYAAMYLLLKLAKGRNAIIEARLPSVLQRGWDSGIYHLRLEVLNFVRYWAFEDHDGPTLSKENRNAVELVLSVLETEDIMLNTQLIDVKSAFGLIELGITIENVQSEITELLNQSDDPLAQQSAAGLISNIFEDVFQGIYYEAIEGLETGQRSKLFSMAALGAPSYSMTASHILEELVKSRTANAAAAFERFSTELDATSCFPQEVTRCFLLAHQGAAILHDKPWKLADLESDDRRAWQCYGELVFWLSKKELTREKLEQQCAPIWYTLIHQLSNAAIDPLMRFADSITFFHGKEEVSHVLRLFNEFRPEIRRLLELGLAGLGRLTCVDTRMQSRFIRREQFPFIVRMLGQLGDLSTIPLLSPFKDDAEFGGVVVESIRALHAGRGFESLQVRSRFQGPIPLQ